jgi:hypothetical protein
MVPAEPIAAAGRVSTFDLAQTDFAGPFQPLQALQDRPHARSIPATRRMPQDAGYGPRHFWLQPTSRLFLHWSFF